MEVAIDYLRRKDWPLPQRKQGGCDDGLVSSIFMRGERWESWSRSTVKRFCKPKTEDFQTFVKNIAMHICATNPQYIRREEIPEEVLERERTIYRTQALEADKPQKVSIRLSKQNGEVLF